ncbi:MAG: hypothetical protein E7127_06305 [Rikenellaceae bacterium]|nr:hypothetical protein [Rikenellaceae bacterium]
MIQSYEKKIFFACVALVVSAAAVVGVKAYNYYSMPELMRANLEALANPEYNFPICTKCHSGGEGALSCSINGGVEIVGVGVTEGCSVSCQGDYFACCATECRCCKER